jgi:hypothetical protein
MVLCDSPPGLSLCYRAKSGARGITPAELIMLFLRAALAPEPACSPLMLGAFVPTLVLPAPLSDAERAVRSR